MRFWAFLLIVLFPHVARALPISDASFFDNLPHTLLDFETDGSGDSVVVPNGLQLALPADEYASSGIRFSRQIFWSNDSNPIEGASPELQIPGAGIVFFDIIFDVPVRSFGFWTVYFPPGRPPLFAALDTNGEVIEAVSLVDLISNIDESGDGIGTYASFMGIASAEPISRVRVRKEAVALDDLRFSGEIPEPGSAALLALGLAASIGIRSRHSRRV